MCFSFSTSHMLQRKLQRPKSFCLYFSSTAHKKTLLGYGICVHFSCVWHTEQKLRLNCSSLGASHLSWWWAYEVQEIEWRVAPPLQGSRLWAKHCSFDQTRPAPFFVLFGLELALLHRDLLPSQRQHSPRTVCWSRGTAVCHVWGSFWPRKMSWDIIGII